MLPEVPLCELVCGAVVAALEVPSAALPASVSVWGVLVLEAASLGLLASLWLAVPS